jgi:hypothetical protein
LQVNRSKRDQMLYLEYENIIFGIIPQEGWNSPDGRQVVLVDVVEDLVVEGDEVFQLRLRHARLGRSHVGQGVRHLGPML